VFWADEALYYYRMKKKQKSYCSISTKIY